jgi:excisionase family DNA binding protein
MGKLHQTSPHVPRISLTPEEAALSTGVSRTRIFEAIRDGKLVARGLGKTTVVEFDELTRWVRSLPLKGPQASAPHTAAQSVAA